MYDTVSRCPCRKMRGRPSAVATVYSIIFRHGNLRTASYILQIRWFVNEILLWRISPSKSVTDIFTQYRISHKFLDYLNEILLWRIFCSKIRYGQLHTVSYIPQIRWFFKRNSPLEKFPFKHAVRTSSHSIVHPGWLFERSSHFGEFSVQNPLRTSSHSIVHLTNSLIV